MVYPGRRRFIVRPRNKLIENALETNGRDNLEEEGAGQRRLGLYYHHLGSDPPRTIKSYD